MEPIIDVKNISFSYDKKDVLKDITFSVYKGEFVAIVGTNGSGKSTLSRLIAGLLFPKSGNIKIDGTFLTEKTIDELRKKIGIIFQNPDNQFVGVTVASDIAFGLENRCLERDEMLSLIDKFSTLTNTNHLLEKSPDECSGGEKQRVALAGVLALNTDILILDEATSMLDPKGVRDIDTLIKEYKGNKTILSITHNLNEIVLADKVLVVHNGELIDYDTPKNIFLNDTLLKAGLVMPENIKVLRKIIQLNNKKLEEAIWESISKM